MNRLLVFRVFQVLSIMGLLLDSACADRPNIVYILADDMGYGDVGALNSECKIATPNLNRLAAEGMIFTDTHSSSSVCTPTRYGILTGRYNWRSRLKHGVLYGFHRRLIEPDRMTVARFLQQHGYHTACVGKWHLGWNWALQDDAAVQDPVPVAEVDFSQPISDGPNSLGFDYFFGIPASLDMSPYVYVENQRCTAMPTAQIDKQEFGRAGVAMPDLHAEAVLPDLTEKAVDYIRKRGIANQATDEVRRPFFLYFPLPAPHTPIAPTKRWQGKSGINAYCDFVMQVDDTVGQVMRALQETGQAERTLLIFTADNGCSPAANIRQMHQANHRPNHYFRGHKADIFDGGHRVPYIARWPERVVAGSQSDQLSCLTDLMATCADMLDTSLPDDAGEDSVSMLPALLGSDTQPLREAVVHHSIQGAFAIRQGEWKLALCPGSGGWSRPKPGTGQTDGLPPIQLYRMGEDVGETVNLHQQYPEIVNRLRSLLQSYVDRGRSTPGVVQANTGSIEIDFQMPRQRK